MYVIYIYIYIYKYIQIQIQIQIYINNIYLITHQLNMYTTIQQYKYIAISLHMCKLQMIYKLYIKTIYMYIYIYICMYVCMYVYIYRYIYIYIIYLYIYKYIYICVCIYSCVLCLLYVRVLSTIEERLYQQCQIKIIRIDMVIA